MFNFIKNLRQPEKRFGTGGLNDFFDERDFKFEEIFLAPPLIEWREKTPDQWRKFPIFDQAGSGSCVGQTVAKLLGIENFLEEGKFIHFSARDIYSRGFQPSGGMYYRDGIDIGYKFGATIEQLMPSQKLNEEIMRKADDRTVLTQQIALVGKAGNYFALPFNFDTIASVISQGKAVALGTKFDSGMWRTGEVKILPGGQYGHAITVVDYCLWKGKKALVFDNSWDYSWGFNGQGVIIEDYSNGIVAAWYYASLPNNWRDTQPNSILKPKYQFNEDIHIGMKNIEVSKLQECLKYDGEFPVLVPITGWFGGITLQSVIDFQKKYRIEPAQGYVGKLTRQQLNKLFS